MSRDPLVSLVSESWLGWRVLLKHYCGIVLGGAKQNDHDDAPDVLVSDSVASIGRAACVCHFVINMSLGLLCHTAAAFLRWEGLVMQMDLSCD